MKVALVYDRVNKWGGAERVLLLLKKLFPDAPLYTSVHHKVRTPWADTFQIHTSFLQRFPGATSAHEYFPLLMPIAFEQFNFDAYDLVISVTSEAAKGVITKPHTKHICYMLTPTRYLWSGYDEYFTNSMLRVISSPAVSYLRTWDKVAAQRPDEIVSISEEVRKRVKTYYGRDSSVIYPPTPEFDRVKHLESEQDFYLVVSRLVPYKHVELAVQACTNLGVPLVVIGSGSELPYLQSVAGPTVQFIGNLTDEELGGYYEQSKALLFPGTEDFGLTILEAQSFGKPVIAYKNGGALETIVEGKTGMFFSDQNVDSLQQALLDSATMKFNVEATKQQAKKFSEKVFQESFLKLVTNVV